MGFGKALANGSRSTIYEWGADAVAKVPLETTPEGWIVSEAKYAETVHHMGLPMPRVIGIETINGRSVSIFERIDGQSLWDATMVGALTATAAGKLLGELHAHVLSFRPPFALAARTTRLICKIRDAAAALDLDFNPILAMIPERLSTNALCHGDFHPKNIILSERGPMIVDWFDVARGDPAGDIARTLLLLRPPAGGMQVGHLPGASAFAVSDLRDAYHEAVLHQIPVETTELALWEQIEAAARLAEGVDDQAELLRVLATSR